MLAGGSELIDDIRRAPDNVLSKRELANEVRWLAKRRVHTHGDRLGHSNRIHARRIGPKRRIHHGHNSFQTYYAGCFMYFQGSPRRARPGNGRIDPIMRAQCVVEYA